MSIIKSTQDSVLGNKFGILHHDHGLSALGCIMPIGTIHGKGSGSSFISFQTLVSNAIKSPITAFSQVLVPHVEINREYSIVLFRTLSENRNLLINSVGEFLTSNNSHTIKQNIHEANVFLRNQNLLGNYTFPMKMEDAACNASFIEDNYKYSNFDVQNSVIEPDPDLIKMAQGSAILFGSSDMANEVCMFASTIKNKTKLQRTRPTFTPGVYTRRADSEKIQGNKLVKYKEFPLCTISFPFREVDKVSESTLKVISKLLGGGSSFSSEGLGTGLNSILYRDVLAKFYTCNEIRSIVRDFNEISLFSFDFQISEDSIGSLCKKLKLVLDDIPNVADELLESAKELVILDRLKSLDSFSDQYRDFAVHLLTGEKYDVTEDIKIIRNVTKSNVTRVCKKLFSVAPSIGSFGASKDALSSFWN